MLTLCRVARFRVMQHEEYPAPVKEHLRVHGIDPDTLFTVVESSDDLFTASTALKNAVEGNRDTALTFQLVDAGVVEVFEAVERQ